MNGSDIFGTSQEHFAWEFVFNRTGDGFQLEALPQLLC